MKFLSWPSGVIQQYPARSHTREIFTVGLGIHRHHDVRLPGPCQIPGRCYAYLVPGGQTLNIGWKIILSNHRNPHAKNCLHQKRIRACRPGAIDRGNSNNEVVYPAFLAHAASSSIA